MHRIDGADHVGNLFTEGDPLIPTPATQVTDDWLNAVQEEIANCIEDLGGTLSKPDNTQLVTQLVAVFGRKASANTWTQPQSFSGGVAGNTSFAADVSVGGTLGVVGNTSLGGSLSVTASTTLTGPATLNGLTTVNAILTAAGGGEGFQLGPGSSDNTLIGFYPTTASPSTRKGWLGFGTPGSDVMSMRNESGSNLELLTAGSGVLTTNTNIVMTGAAPASSTAFTNTQTPANICKAWAVVDVAAGGPTLVDGFNVSSVANFDANLVQLNFASNFSNTTYACAYDSNDSNYEARTATKTASYMWIAAKNGAGAVAPIGTGATGTPRLTVVVFGRQ